jgi:hypothetical protein
MSLAQLTVTILLLIIAALLWLMNEGLGRESNNGE